MVKRSLLKALWWYATVSVCLVAAALGVVAFTKAQSALYLCLLGGLFVLWTIGCGIAWRVTYLEMNGNFLRDEARRLAKDIDAFIEERRALLGAHLIGSSEYRREERGVCSDYATTFFARLDKFVGDVRSRGDFGISDATRIGFLNPKSLSEIELIAAEILTFSKAYKAQKG